jgi:hypothetical protein
MSTDVAEPAYTRYQSAAKLFTVPKAFTVIVRVHGNHRNLAELSVESAKAMRRKTADRIPDYRASLLGLAPLG